MKSKNHPWWVYPVLLGMVVGFPWQSWADGRRGGGPRPSATTARPGIARPLGHFGRPVSRVLIPQRHHFFYYPYAHPLGGYYRQPIVVISPAYDPYYAPPVVFTSSPFYCLAHRAGWVSRVGMVDHLSGAHGIPLDTAWSICPEGIESCVVDGYYGY